MYKRPKIASRLRSGVIDSKTGSMPSEVSDEVQPNVSTPPSELADTSQLESVESSVENWSASGAHPLPTHPKFSQWHSELREIRWECEKDVWESCPYD